MNKLARFPQEQILVLDDRPPTASPLRLSLRLTLSLVQENHHHHDHHETSSNPTSSIHDDHHHHPPPAAFPWRLLPEIFPWDGGEVQENYHHHGETSSNSTAVLDDGVDTTLRLGFHSVPRNPQTRPPPAVLNTLPMLLLWPDSAGEDFPDTTLALGLPGTTTDHKKSRNPGKRMKGGGDDENEKKKRKRRRVRHGNNDQEQQPFLPIEEIEGLALAVAMRGGSADVFLYRKALTESDIKKDQNRVFVSKEEKLIAFLTESEAAALHGDGKGLTVVGVDAGGRVYNNLVMKKWESMDMIVIKSDWSKVVAANNAQRGEVVEIWGYRENEKPCLAFNFRREEEAR